MSNTRSEELPHFSTAGYNFRHRFTEERIERVFQWGLNETGTAGALTPAAVFIDGTHIKASANLNKKIKQKIPAAAKRYREELLAEINADREAHGKKPLDDDDGPPKPTGKKRDNTSKKKLARRKKAGFKTMTKSITGPACGMFVKGKHQRQFAYKAHTACDKNGHPVSLPGCFPPVRIFLCFVACRQAVFRQTVAGRPLAACHSLILAGTFNL